MTDASCDGFICRHWRMFMIFSKKLCVCFALVCLLTSCGAPTTHRHIAKSLSSDDTSPQDGPSDDARPEEPLCDADLNSCGSGGQLGLVEGTFSNTQGMTSQFKINAPQDISLEKSYGLLLYIHGDGAADYEWFFSDFSKVAQDKNLIPLAVKAPSLDNWLKDPDQNADYLDQLIQTEIFKKYNVKNDSIYFVGVSSGQSFLAGHFIRFMGDRVPAYQGGAILLCGGSANIEDATQSLSGADFKNFPLFFKTGTKDFMLEKTKKAVNFYNSQGVKVTTQYPEGIGHCRFPLNEAITSGFDSFGAIF